MTRAEEKALEHTGYCHNRSYEDYLRGYKQAEKDLALTWKDIAKIDALILDVNNEMAIDYSQVISRQKFYEEVLRRFNEAKK